MSKVVVIVCKPSLKIKRGKDFCWRLSRQMDFLSQLRAGTGSFHVKNVLSLNTTDFTYYLSYIVAKENFVICFHSLRHPLPTSRLFLLLQKAFFLSFYFKQKFLYSSFYLLFQRNKRVQSVKVQNLQAQLIES